MFLLCSIKELTENFLKSAGVKNMFYFDFHVPLRDTLLPHIPLEGVWPFNLSHFMVSETIATIMSNVKG